MDINKDAEKLLKEAKEKRGESKGAPKASPAKKEKTKEELDAEAKIKATTDAEAKKKAETDAEAKKKADKEALEKNEKDLLSKKDEDLDEDGKKKKSELVKRNKLNERFGVLTGEIKDLKRLVETKGKENDTEREKRDALEKELAAINTKLKMSPTDVFRESVKKELATRHSKYLEEDKALPREQRREITDEELDAWYEEEPRKARAWDTERIMRIRDEEKELVETKTFDGYHKKVLVAQQTSQTKLYERYPELETAHKRMVALGKEGKKPNEIHDIVSKEHSTYKVAHEILMSNKEKYVLAPNGPELVADALDKRKASKKQVSESEDTKKKLEEAEAEIERLKGLDVGLNSNRRSESTIVPDDEKELGKLASEVGLDPKKVIGRAKNKVASGNR